MFTCTRDELNAGTFTVADVWGFGCSVLKIFLSHSGAHKQKQVCVHTHVQFESVTCVMSALGYVCPILAMHQGFLGYTQYCILRMCIAASHFCACVIDQWWTMVL